MALSFDDLFTPSTRDQSRASLVTLLQNLGVDPTGWRKGGVFSTILTGCAWLHSDMTQLVSLALGFGFVEKATGGWLKLLAKYDYGIDVDSLGPTFATGPVIVRNTCGGVFTFAAGQLRVINPTANKAYFNTDPFTINALQTLSVNFQAVEIGSASNAAPGQISQLETPVLGLSVTNTATLAGSDGISDPDLQAMCLDKLGTLSNGGPRSAYAYAIRAAKRLDGTPCNINRWSISSSSSTGTVDVYLASPAGVPDSQDVTAVTNSIEALARPDAVTVNVHACTAVATSASLTVWVKQLPGVLAADVSAAVSAALLAAIEAYPIAGIAKPPATQGYLWAEYVAGVAQAAHPAIFAVDGAGADLALNAGQVATFASTVTVNLVPVGGS